MPRRETQVSPTRPHRGSRCFGENPSGSASSAASPTSTKARPMANSIGEKTTAWRRPGRLVLQQFPEQTAVSQPPSPRQAEKHEFPYWRQYSTIVLVTGGALRVCRKIGGWFRGRAHCIVSLSCRALPGGSHLLPGSQEVDCGGLGLKTELAALHGG